MTDEEAVAALDAIQADAHVVEGKRYSTGDPEAAHGEADDVLLSFVPESVRDAWERVAERLGGFWYA